MNKRIIMFCLLLTISICPVLNWTMILKQEKIELARIVDSAIELKKGLLTEAIVKSNKLRKVAKAATYCVAIAAAAGAGYRFFSASSPLVSSVNALTQEKIYALFADLYQQVRPPMFSWDWYKSILFNPVTMIELTFFGIKQGHAFLNDHLYSADLAWILEHKTRLGTLVRKGIDANEHFEFEPGVLFKELERSGVTLDSGARPRSLLPIDEPYEREHLVQIINDFVEDFSLILGFMDFLVDRSSNEQYQLTINKSSFYLKQCLDSFFVAVENRLNNDSNDLYMPLIQEFVAQVKQSMIRFVDAQN